MRLEDLIRILQKEETAEAYLREKGILKTFSECIFCKSPTIGKIRRNFYRCHRCKREWSSRKGSILENESSVFVNFEAISFGDTSKSSM